MELDATIQENVERERQKEIEVDEIDGQIWTEEVERTNNTDNTLKWAAMILTVWSYMISPILELNQSLASWNTKVGNFFVVLICFMLLLNLYNYKVECIMS